MVDYIEHILSKNWFQRIFFRMKPEAYKIAEDIIFLQKNNYQEDLEIVSIHKYTSSTIQREIDGLVRQNSLIYHTINSIIEKYEKYIEITFALKNIDILIRTERKRNIIQVSLCVFTAICAIIGSIIGGILGNSDWLDWIKTLITSGP